MKSLQGIWALTAALTPYNVEMNAVFEQDGDSLLAQGAVFQKHLLCSGF